MKEILLVSQAKCGDPDAFVELMELHKSAMYRTAVSILHNDADAADAMQDTILKCWQSIGTLQKPQYFKTWMTRILINCCKDIIRKNGELVYLENYDGMNTGMDTRLSDRQVQDCIDSLHENYRLIFTLHYMQGLTVKEIAALLSMNENTVKTRLARGRNEFRKIYCDEEAASL